MFSLLSKLFRRPAPTPQPIRPGDPVPPGMRVRIRGEDRRGVVSAFEAGDFGEPKARVVFTGDRRTWVEQVSLHRIVL